MSERFQTARPYVVTFAILATLTIATVAASFLPLAGTWHVVIGLTIAAAKASLVLAIFMHLRGAPALTKIVVLVAAFWLVFLVALTLTDYLSRTSATQF